MQVLLKINRPQIGLFLAKNSLKISVNDFDTLCLLRALADLDRLENLVEIELEQSK